MIKRRSRICKGNNRKPPPAANSAKVSNFDSFACRELFSRNAFSNIAAAASACSSFDKISNAFRFNVPLHIREVVARIGPRATEEDAEAPAGGRLHVAPAGPSLRSNPCGPNALALATSVGLATAPAFGEYRNAKGPLRAPPQLRLLGIVNLHQ